MVALVLPPTSTSSLLPRWTALPLVLPPFSIVMSPPERWIVNCVLPPFSTRLSWHLYSAAAGAAREAVREAASTAVSMGDRRGFMARSLRQVTCQRQALEGARAQKARNSRPQVQATTCGVVSSPPSRDVRRHAANASDRSPGGAAGRL